ncbi:MAG: ATP-binding protein [Acidimicrobiaceae bacterium]|nr:ATP-binding protein [Acidimicrobiaceae bacterium]
MATADQVKALIKSHASGDDERFYAVALQLAATEARSGHASYAQDLKALIDAGRGQPRAAVPTPVAAPRGELASLLTAAYPDERLADLSLAAPLRRELKRVLHEQRQRDRLRSRGFAPARRLLLVGPPGTGKTMTARALAGELSLPLLAVRLDGLITKFMGETAAKLRLIFDAMVATTGIYLFDEVDALAGTRAATNDVGEIKRVLNSFLQFLEDDDSDSVLIATSNLPEALDRALFRRFDTRLEYCLPDVRIGNMVIRNRLAALDLADIDWRKIGAAAKGLSHSEITVAAEGAAKATILADRQTVDTQTLLETLDARHRADSHS